MNIVRNIVVLALSIVSMAAQATVITFEDQIVESKPNGYTVSGVTFFDTLDEDLFVADLGGNKALAIQYDDGSVLGMIFPSISNSLSLMFGNDDPSLANPGDIALLELYLNGTQVAAASVPLNRNGAIDQTISIVGVNFDQAGFGFTTPEGAPIKLTELVDNISFTTADGGPAPIPEPASIALLGLGLLGVAVSRRKHRAAA